LSRGTDKTEGFLDRQIHYMCCMAAKCDIALFLTQFHSYSKRFLSARMRMALLIAVYSMRRTALPVGALNVKNLTSTNVMAWNLFGLAMGVNRSPTGTRRGWCLAAVFFRLKPESPLTHTLSSSSKTPNGRHRNVDTPLNPLDTVGQTPIRSSSS
jgi:hypothetical protein